MVRVPSEIVNSFSSVRSSRQLFSSALEPILTANSATVPITRAMTRVRVFSMDLNLLISFFPSPGFLQVDDDNIRVQPENNQRGKIDSIA